jgi:malate dehydrogenase
MGIASEGSYGIPEGVIYGYPVTCSNGRYEIVRGIELSTFSKSKMEATHRELLEERDAVKGLF